MTNTDFTFVLTLARTALANIRNQEAEYQAEMSEYYTNGEGARPNWVSAGTQPWFDPENDDSARMVNIGGNGYTFPYCIHGVSRWVDFDCACGACEDSVSATSQAVAMAASAVRQFNERSAWARSAPGNPPTAVWEWAFAPISAPIFQPPPK